MLLCGMLLFVALLYGMLLLFVALLYRMLLLFGILLLLLPLATTTSENASSLLYSVTLLVSLS